MSVLESDQLAELIGRKHTCLGELREIGQRQLQLVRGGEMSSLLGVLAVKQRLIERLQSIERELDPFRTQSPESRCWRSEIHRQRCAKEVKLCEELFAEILRVEKQGETELVQRRDETAKRLDSAHRAGMTRGAYMETCCKKQGGQLDVASEQ